MLYSIGYQKLTHERIRNIMERIKSEHLIDVRSIPMSRRMGFGKRQLGDAFPREYRWEGYHLGGIKPGTPGTTKEGLDWLALFQRKNNPLIMCQCHSPGSCHRHVLIATPLLERGIDTRHIFEDQVILASELKRSIDDDDDYEYEEL